MALDLAQLDHKLAALEQLRAWSPRVLAKLEALVAGPDERAVLRVNPLAFARDRGVAVGEAIDLFLHATRLGLFTLDWHLLCPCCGGAVESFASLRGLHRGVYCALCALRADANLDDFIQVSFTVAPGVRRLRFHDPESLTAAEFLYQLRLTPEMHLGDLDGPRMVDVMPQFLQVLDWVGPGARLPFAFDTPGPGAFTVAEFHAHTGTTVDVRDDATADEVELVIAERELLASTPTVRPGRIRGAFVNQRPRPLVVAISFDAQADLDAGRNRPRTTLAPILTGAMLLTNQTFRRLFRGETIGGSEGLGVRDVTLLFTDLKSSTALYERIGDLRAFTLVQRHFERLGAVVQAHTGAVVKTIGDAVMAAFQHPRDAVRAALAMRAEIDAFNREHGSRDVVLKIGVHRGPSIAVTLNDSLDYFGHTVNVAARVQGLADADEIYLTEDVYRADGVTALVPALEARDVRLRGIEAPVRVRHVPAPA